MAQLGSSKIFGDLIVLGKTKVHEDIYENGEKLSDKYVGKAQVLTDVPINAKFTDTIATKKSLGLDNVDNVQQASKAEHDRLVDVVNKKAGKAAVLTTTLNTTWSGSSAPYTKSQTVSGIESTDTPIIDVVMSSNHDQSVEVQENWSYIYRAVTSTNKITFYATDKPTVSLPIQIKVVR